jgi:uncharacterized protein with PIN domain
MNEQKKDYKCPNCGGVLVDLSFPDMFKKLFIPLRDSAQNRWRCAKCNKVFEKVKKQQ